jgi:small subunit ribosomal protein S20
MPTTKAAAKAFRQNIKARARNKAIKDSLKKLSVKLRKAIAAKQADQAQSTLKEFVRAFDRAAQKKVVTKNMAGRRKSRAVKAVRALKA